MSSYALADAQSLGTAWTEPTYADDALAALGHVCDGCRPWHPSHDVVEVVEVLDAGRARFLVETAGRRGATRTVHLHVPRTVLLDVVADMDTLSIDRPDLFSGDVSGGDSTAAFCEPADGRDVLVALHVGVVDLGSEWDLGRAALLILLKIAERTSQTFVNRRVLPTLTASLAWDWSEEVPLLP